jgi:Uma2 family endonuclease
MGWHHRPIFVLIFIPFARIMVLKMSVLPADFNPVPRPMPITVDLYHYMAEKGAFAPDERLELIDGEIFPMSPIGSFHARCVDFLTEFLVKSLDDIYMVRVQNPIISAFDTEPQPDLVIARRTADRYKSQHPTGKDTVIVIEVADTTASFDRNRKFPKYAQAGIPEAWLIDLKRDVVEIHSDPGTSGYGDVQTFRRGERAVSKRIDTIDLAVEDILG